MRRRSYVKQLSAFFWVFHAAFLLCAALICAPPLHAQSKVILTRTVTFDSPDSAWQGTGVRALRLASGEYLLIGRCRLFLFDARGKYLRRVGREGRGPGEFQCAMSAAVGRGDSVAVFDFGRTSILTPKLEFARLVPPEKTGTRVFIGRMFIQQPDGSWVMETGGYAGGTLKHDVYHFAPDWSVVPFSTYRRSQRDFLKYPPGLLAAHGGGQFWGLLGSLDPGMELGLFDGTGLLTRTLKLNPSWWVAIDWGAVKRREDKPGTIVPPYSSPVDIREDKRGRLWVLATVPAADWRKYPMQHLADGSTYESPRRNNTMIELVDPNSGKTLASTRFEFAIQHFIDDTHVLVAREDEDGNMVFEVYSIDVR
jgi:hypothetical protein